MQLGFREEEELAQRFEEIEKGRKALQQKINQLKDDQQEEEENKVRPTSMLKRMPENSHDNLSMT